MYCRIAELRAKQVICVKNGAVLGYVGDVEVDTCSGRVLNLIVYGRPRFFGIFGRCDDTVLPFGCIEVIGKDVMLANYDVPPSHRKKHGFFSSLFSDGYSH